MNRRVFLKKSSFVIGAAILSPLLPSCTGPSPLVATVATVGVWLATYALNIGASTAFESIQDYINKQTATEASKIIGTNEMMKEMGFVQFDERKVYQEGDTYLYQIGYRDGFNACAPFFNRQKELVPFVEGPTIVGLAMAAEEYRKEKSAAQVANAFIPIEDYQRPANFSFGADYEKEYVSLTDYGTVVVDYKFNGSNSGEVVVAIENQGLTEGKEWTFKLTFS